jgi:hypothetical protein
MQNVEKNVGSHISWQYAPFEMHKAARPSAVVHSSSLAHVWQTPPRQSVQTVASEIDVAHEHASPHA